jgi:UDP-glucose 4-epimerase
MAKIFVTGGAGYIGSHTVLELLHKNHAVTVIDNLENSSLNNLEQVKKMSGHEITFIEGDLRDYNKLNELLSEGYDAVIHFAAYKSVVESFKEPLRYYENNVGGSINLFKAMLKNNIRNVIFSSSAAVYGQPQKLPVTEDEPLKPNSVYAQTKAMMEQIMKDSLQEGMNSIALRYFNVAGADPSGLIGEDPKAMGNLIPRLFMNLIGKHELKIYGNQFPTRDGYQIRDYIHVSDLANAHVLALDHLMQNPGYTAFNLGTNRGTSVMELVQEVERVTGKKIEYQIIDPQPGENIEIYADATKAQQELGWQASYDHHQIIEHAWKWYSSLPEFKDIVG